MGWFGKFEEIVEVILWLFSDFVFFVMVMDFEVDGGLGGFVVFVDFYELFEEYW